MVFPIVVSFYTQDTGYEQEVNNLIASLNKFNLEYDIEAIVNTGNWVKNTKYKATLISKMLKKHKRPVLFLDADAVVRQYPSLFEEITCDMAWWGSNTGTLYFANTRLAWLTLCLWIRLCELQNDWDQRILAEVTRLVKPKVYELPYSYCHIFDSGVEEPPVIEHFQASRRFKNAVTRT